MGCDPARLLQAQVRPAPVTAQSQTLNDRIINSYKLVGVVFHYIIRFGNAFFCSSIEDFLMSFEFPPVL